ncbi:D-alanyl-D-alanine carboxypeptidase [Rhodanobacter sp. FW510-R12]|uniref:D-alanyl-D-alanine carboxypeptidase family protein n=1 Tax=unclassified Rhodanobacter TaxID=2621553 RepID=UPI0007AA36BB|nr:MULTISPECIES: D-alanyl-D-alanine carboxypeptidase family protein [unclassified Rhodanobacter]KZC15505.1 D-alanyl-D-alanine carboxypeptidase [Rhodanobacter sp. FW104-R8]KZC26003.1 D-alanyl-D-alanine carboxypeptidase [Rhodanobacter sp. FW510-T8]KZC29732.1 D-alanyl-D-alanine carboxypeptidase [Rhodanobacter sp. FW510-R10]
MNFFRRTLIPFAAITLLVGAAVAQTQPRPSPVPRPVVPEAPVPPPPDVDGKSWVLMDYATGQILASKEPDLRVEPASITKVMTDYVVSAEIANGKIHMTDPVTISENAWRGGGAGTDGSTSFLKLNSQVPLKDLLYGMIIQSGNDAAIALAEHTAGSEPAFAGLMNAYAKQLGMANSNFENASGYPIANHYTTAHDIALLSRALVHDFPEDYAISAIKEFEWNGIKQHNRNTLLWRDPSVDGIKTGHTAGAGYCLAASAKQGESRMIAIVMGASSEKARADSAMALLNYGFRFYETHKLYDAGKPLATPRLWKGATNQLPLGVADAVQVTVKRGQYDQLKATMDIPATLIAPFTKGQQVGTLRITLAGQPVQNVPLVALADAPQGGFFSRLWDSILLWFHSDKKADAEAPAKSADAK